MTDESPGKVQALRAMFSEKNNVLMGLMPPGVTKIPNRPWRSADDSDQVQPTALKEKKINEIRFGNKVLPVPDKNPTPFNGDCCEKQTRLLSSKPVIGPKPNYLVQQQQQLKIQSLKSVNSDGSAQKNVSDARSKAFGETIASFMFTNNKENENSSGSSITSSAPPPLPQLPKPRISQLLSCADALNSKNTQDENNQHCNGISSDNYVCKVRRKELPSKEKLGPAPLKPLKPVHMILPSNFSQSKSNFSQSQSSNSSQTSLISPPTSLQKPGSLQRPSYPCPPRPVASPPLPPTSAPVIQRNPASMREEIEELYEDTLFGDKKRPVSLIPEYTEEEEQAELYNDAIEYEEEDSLLKNKKPPPPPVPSEYLQPNVNGSMEELYQDADQTTQEEFYEIMPCDEIQEDNGSPLYSNNKREIEKLKKDEEKRMRREQKEREKREKELEKLKKKFGLTGEEIPIDDGLVKWDSRGGKGDLSVKKGETVLILRMEGNPSGKWLVKNEKGKIGYVELTNIEVDPLSVKSVMSIRRLSVISGGEELYCEAKSEDEPIYEVTY